MLYRNVASQKWIVFAFNETTGVATTGDAANITAKISQDGAAGSATNDTNPTELEDGYYVFDLTQAETNADLLLILPESSTASVAVVGVPGSINPRTDVVAFGTADSGSTTTVVDAARTEADTDYWKGCTIHFLSGTIQGQSRLITGFTPGTDTITYAPATTQAASTNDYEIRPWGNVDLVNTVTTLTGHTAQTGDSYARLGAPAGASVSADIATIDGNVDSILTDTADMQPKLGTPAGADMSTDIAAIKTDTAAILVDTADMQPKLGTPAGVSISADIATVDSNVDAILVDTGTTIPATLGTPAGADMSADIAAVKTDTAATLVDTNELQGDWTNGGRLDLLIDAIKVITDALGATAAANLALSAGQMIAFTVDTVTNTHTPTTTEFQADDITEATTDHYNGRIVIFTSGALAGQATDITGYSLVGGIGQFTVTAMTEAPANNDTGIIV